jgi:hypothetical protein
LNPEEVVESSSAEVVQLGVRGHWVVRQMMNPFESWHLCRLQMLLGQIDEVATLTVLAYALVKFEDHPQN